MQATGIEQQSSDIKKLFKKVWNLRQRHKASKEDKEEGTVEDFYHSKKRAKVDERRGKDAVEEEVEKVEKEV